MVGHEVYGIYGALFGLTYVYSILTDMGITNYNQRSIASDPDKLKAYLPNILVAKTMMSLVYFGVITAAGWITGYRGPVIELMLWMGLLQMLTTFTQYLRSNISGLQLFRTDSWLSATDKLIVIGICGTLLYTNITQHHFEIKWFVWSQILAYSVTALISFIIIRGKITFTFSHLHLGKVWTIVKESLPYALAILLMSFYTRMDVFLLERFAPGNSAEQAGIYASAYRLVDICSMPGLMIAGILIPLYARLLAEDKPIREMVTLSTNLLMPVSLSIVAFSVMHRYGIMNFLSEHNNAQSYLVFAIVIGCVPALSLMYLYSSILGANGQLKPLIHIAIIGVLVYLAGASVLIPAFGATGAAINAVTAQTIVGISYTFITARKHHLPFRPLWIGNYILFFIEMVLLNGILHYIGCHWLVSAAINVPVFASLVVIHRLTTIPQIKSFFQLSKK